MSETLKINLTQFKSLGSDGILVGRYNGIYARMILMLDEVDQWVKNNQELKLEFQFPDSVWTVSDSFLKGLLHHTYHTLGSDTFTARVKFYTNNEVLKGSLDRDIEEFVNVIKNFKPTK